jgi:hypothetical protein
MRNPTSLALLTAVCLAATAPATATAGLLPDGGVTAQEVAAVLQEKGYKAEITTDSTGDPTVMTAADGSNVSIYFYDCKGEGPRCTSIQFVSAFDIDDGMSLSKINLWNRENRFGRAYLDDENDPFVEMDVDVEHGFTTESLATWIDTWIHVLPRFKSFIGF